VAAAVILPRDAGALASLLGVVDDSKRLTPRQREHAFDLLQRHAAAIGVGRSEAAEIDRVGIVPATRAAMAAALAGLSDCHEKRDADLLDAPDLPDMRRAYARHLRESNSAIQPDFVLLDYLTLPECVLPQRGVPHGDALSLSIAAASVIAKVTRDRWMVEQAAIYPGYGFARHKGYGTAEHAAALARLGPCPLHRLSFAPVAAVVIPTDLAQRRKGAETQLR
jgi:ribonuclease HII